MRKRGSASEDSTRTGSYSPDINFLLRTAGLEDTVGPPTAIPLDREQSGLVGNMLCTGLSYY